jgi:hypothetical protein
MRRNCNRHRGKLPLQKSHVLALNFAGVRGNCGL